MHVTLTRLSYDEILKYQHVDSTPEPSANAPQVILTFLCKVVVRKLSLTPGQIVVLKQPSKKEAKDSQHHHLPKINRQGTKSRKPSNLPKQAKQCTHTFSMRRHVLKKRYTNAYLKCRVSGCSMAYVSFSTGRNATAHHRLHHPKTTFACSICAKMLTTPNSLRVRMYCDKEMQYKCDVCDQSFVYRSKLKQHKRDMQNPRCMNASMGAVVANTNIHKI